MEEKDIQALFSYMKNELTLDCKHAKLTRSMAKAWCDMFNGYTLDQLKEAARSHAMGKPFWPKPSELSEKLPELPGAADITSQPSPYEEWIWVWWEARKVALDAAGLPSAAEALERGIPMAEYKNLLEEAGL